MKLELVIFKQKKGCDEKAFMAVMERMSDFCKKQKGFVYRALTHNTENDLWCDSIYWEDEKSMNQADENFNANGLCEEFSPIIEPDSVQMNHTDVVLNLDNCSMANTQ